DDESDEACESEMISDLSIILDRKTTPAFFCMVQYYGPENELTGDKRNCEPQLILSKGEICSTATWSKDGITVAGGKDYGDKLDQLAHPYGIFLNDDDDTIYIADHDNDRIVMWKQNAIIGQWVAGVKDKDTTEKFSL
ncbi:unnamed protein product, partial [Adineta steineri]